jgi:ferrous iron transport protein A
MQPDPSHPQASSGGGSTPSTVAALALGQGGVIERVRGSRVFRRRLLEMGFVPGTEVRLLNVAPLGDPLELEMRGCKLSIRRHEGGAIELRADKPRRHLQVTK